MPTKKIKIKCHAADSISFKELKGLQGKLKTITRDDLDRLKNSILSKGFSAPIFVWHSPAKVKWILDGHSRKKALLEFEKEGYEIPNIPIAYIQAKTKKEAQEKLLLIASEYGIISEEGFKDFIDIAKIDLSDLSNIIQLPDITIDDLESVSNGDKEEDIEIPQTRDILDVEQITEILNNYDNIFFAFSGGKDSLLPLLQILPLVRKLKIEHEVLFVETGTEIPDISYFVIEICHQLRAKLKILKPKRNFFEIYGRDRKFPSPIFKPCVSVLINDAIDNYVKTYSKPLLIRGGRKDQRNNRKRRASQMLIDKKKKGYTITLFNPYYYVSKEIYNKELKKVALWPGYKKGFNRTACWCCPFQKPEQYIALKKYYPILWQILKDMSDTWIYPDHKGDGHRKRFYQHFQESESINDLDIM